METTEAPMLNLRMEYPRSDKYEYEARLVRLNLDEEAERDLARGKGFLIKEPQDVKKVLKDIDGICSTRYGRTLQDPKAYEDRYSCKCGHLKGRNNRYILCPKCHHECVFIGDDFEIFGYIPIHDYTIIHPNLYKAISAYFGDATMEAMIEPSVKYDKDGMPILGSDDDELKGIDKRIKKRKIKRTFAKKRAKIDQTYQGIGMIGFCEKFDEILEYFKKKNKNRKIGYYNDIIENRDKIFIHHIPVFTTLLRPYKVEGKHLIFEETNSILNMMAKLAGRLNDNGTFITDNYKYKSSLLWDLQDRYNRLYKIIEKILSSKRGTIRMLIGVRCDFTSRLVITPDPTLHTDEIKVSYFSLVELLQQTIINVLAKTFNLPYADAYNQWFRAQLVIDPQVVMIINNLIERGTKFGRGIPIVINRNPTINYGSVLAMKCVGMVESYTMSVPLTCLKTLAAD